MRNEQEIQLFEKSLASVDTFTDKGFENEALQMIGALEQAYPEMKQELLWKKINVFVKKQSDEDVLVTLIELCEVYKDEDAYSCILENYVNNKIDALLELYHKNREWVLSNKNCYCEIDENPKWIAFYKSDDLVIGINLDKKEFRGNRKRKINYDELIHAPVMLISGIFCSQIKEVAKRTCFENAYNGIEHAFYLVFKEWEWELFLQCVVLEEEFDSDRYIFLVEERGIRDCFMDHMAPLPEKTIDLQGGSGFVEVIEKLYVELIQSNILIKEKVEDYYSVEQNIKRLEDRIKSHCPRILFKTSKYTTVLQYHCKNSMDAAEELGCECRFLIEPDSVRRISNLKESEVIDEFKPDVVFVLDHFRYEYTSAIPDAVFFVTWIQDPMDHIVDSNTKNRLKSRDVVLNHIFTWNKMKELYPDILVDAPVPANEKVYKPYELSEKERNDYSADICFVCHASDVDVWIDETLNRLKMNDDIKEIFRELFAEYQEMAKNDIFFYSKEEFEEFINDGFIKRGWNLNQGGIELMADEAFKWLNQRVFRQTLVDWIIDAGFTNIKLWGDGWKTNPRYTEYAMGPAENGETLSKIYQASKIVLGNNIMTTGAARAWESMLSGAFYLSNLIPPECDWCDIRKIMPKGTLEYFRNKEELISKLHYYLEHDNERKVIAEKCRKEALKRMTFKALIEKVLNILPDYLEK